MPIFRVRLEDPNSDEFRVVTTEAGSKEEAQANALRLEDRNVRFALADDELATLEAREEALRGREKAQLYIHRQMEPYRIVSIEKVN